MNDESGRLSFGTAIDTSGFDEGAARIESRVADVGKKVESESARIGELLSNVPNVNINLTTNASKSLSTIQQGFDEIDRVVETNKAAIKELEAEYARLGAEMTDAYNSGNDAEYARLKKSADAVKQNITVRHKVNEEAAKTADQLAEVEKKLQKEADAAAKAEARQASFRSQLMNTRNEMRQLAAAGQQDTEQYEVLRQKVVELTRAMNATNKQVKALSVPTSQVQGLISGLSGIAGAASVAQGAIGLFGGENEELQKIMLRVQSLMSITIGLQQIQQTLSKNSAFNLVTLNGLKKIWAKLLGESGDALSEENTELATNTAQTQKNAAATTADTAAQRTNNTSTTAGTAAQAANTAATRTATAATVAGTVATKAASVALRGLKAALISTGIGALIVLVGELIGWLSSLIEKTTEAKKKEKELQEITNEGAEAYAKARGEMNGYVTKIEKFNGTKEQEKNLIKELNSKYGTEIGFYKTLAGWKEALIAKGEKYCETLLKEAEAQALLSKYVEVYTKKIETQAKNPKEYGGLFISKGTAQKRKDVAVRDIDKELKGWEEKYKEKIAETQAIKTENNLGGYTDPDTAKSKGSARSVADRKAKIAEYTKKVSAAVAQAELEIRQAELGAMEESYEKSKAQIGLNYDRLILENEKRRAEMIEALKDNMTNEWLNANPNATKEQEVNYRASLNVGTEDLSKGQQDALAGYEIAAARDYTKAIEDLNKKRLESERASIQEYLKEYGEYEDKRVALRQEAEDKIAKIRANGNLTDTDKEYQIKGVEEGLEQSLKDLDLEKLKKDMDWDTVFGNIDNLPVEVLNVAREQLEQFRDAANDLSPEQIKVVTEALEQLKDRSDLSRPVQSIKNAAAAYKTAKKEFQAASKAYKAAQKAGDTKKMETASKQMIRSSKEMADAAETEKNAYEVLSGAIEEYAGFLKEAGDTIGGTAGEMLKLASSALTCGTSMAAGIQAFSAAMSTMEKSVAILAIISAAFQLIQGIVSLFGGKEDTTLKTYVEAMDNYIDLLNDSINDLNDAIMDTKNTIAETLDIYKELVGLEGKQAEAIKSQNRVWLNSGASRESHSEGYKLAKEITDGMDSSDKETRAFYSSAFNKLDQYKRKATNGEEGAYQSGLGRLDWLWDLSDDELRSIANDPKLLAVLGETGEAIVEYVQALDAKQQLEDALNEAILGVSWDSFYDDFVEMISDMDVTSEEFADNFTEYMRNALIREMVNTQFKSRLENVFKKAANLLKSGKEITDEDIEGLQNEYRQIGEEARKQVELINQITGYEAEAASREASQKGIATASQESVDENNARLTTIQGHTYMLAQNSGENKVYLMAASEHLKAIREIASTGLQHLTDISRNTYQLYETNQRLKRVEEDLSGINTKGVIIRNV